jgi:1,4-alpha-glucan branching enzyme
MMYDPVLAFNQTKHHADHFVSLINDLLRDQFEKSNDPDNLVMVSFDTELYGHWWFEGVSWLKHVIRAMHSSQNVEIETSSGYLQKHPPKQAIELPESTWGQGGHYWVWRNQHTDWMWPIIHSAETRFRHITKELPSAAKGSLEEKVLDQALRELLLLQSSDWPFLVTTFQAKDYAIERFEGHVERFNKLCDMIVNAQLSEEGLAEIVDVDNPFPSIDYRWFQAKPLTTPTPEPMKAPDRLLSGSSKSM